MALDLAGQMRVAMRRLASGVCVITSMDENQTPFAMTASSVTSVSDDPPSLLVCVNKSARIDPAIVSTGCFAVNILGGQHKAVSNNCANPELISERFDEGDWRKDTETGLMYLNSSPAVLFCVLSGGLRHGTHNVYIGDIQATRVGEDNGSVLGYLNGGYRDIPFDVA